MPQFEAEHLAIIAVALIGAVAPTIASIAALYVATHTKEKVAQLDIKINGRIDQLVDEARRAATAEAKLDQRVPE